MFYQFLKGTNYQENPPESNSSLGTLWECCTAFLGKHTDVLNPCPAPGAVCSMGVAELAGIAGAGTRGRSNCLVDLRWTHKVLINQVKHRKIIGKITQNYHYLYLYGFFDNPSSNMYFKHPRQDCFWNLRLVSPHWGLKSITFHGSELHPTQHNGSFKPIPIKHAIRFRPQNCKCLHLCSFHTDSWMTNHCFCRT